MRTTLLKARELGPCKPGYKKMLDALNKTQADDELVDMLFVLDTIGVIDTLWALRAVTGHDDMIQDYYDWCFTLIPPKVPFHEVQLLINQCTTFYDVKHAPYKAAARECIMNVALAIARTIASADYNRSSEEWEVAYQNVLTAMDNQLRTVLSATE